MITSSNTNGLYIKCSMRGEILSVRNSGIPGIDKDETLSLFPGLFQGESVEGALDFITSVKRNGAEFGRRLLIKTKDKPVALFFSGALIDDFIIITGIELQNNFTYTLNEMLVMSNEQANLIRDLYKGTTLNIQAGIKPETEHYLAELSRVNNELTDMQRNLAKKNRELDELNKLKNNFLGMAAHDIRNPLTLIINYCEMASDVIKNDPEKAQAFLSRISHFAHTSLGIVSNFLSVSTIESGRLTLHKELVSVVKIIKDVIEFNSHSADSKRINVFFDSGTDDFTLYADSQKIFLVINNLLSNAIKFSPENSDVLLTLTREKNIYRFDVTDQGPGLSTEAQKLLFKPYGTANNDTEQKKHSTGLGLYISKKIITEHGGVISVDSQPGKGSKFWFTLPL